MFCVENHLQGGIWIGDESGQYLRVMPQDGFEEEEWERCQHIADLLNKESGR